MRIAQVAPLYESVPPKLYGGTERVVSYLTEELVRQGHEVTLFASGDSVTGALVSAAPTRPAARPRCVDPLAHHVLHARAGLRSARPSSTSSTSTSTTCTSRWRGARPSAHVTTLHGRLDIPDLPPLYREFRDMPLVSISDAQRAPLPKANWRATVHHGLPRTCTAAPERRAATWRSWGASRPRSASTARSTIAQRVRHAAQDRRQGRPGRTTTTSRTIIAPLLDDPLDRVRRRDRRRREGASSWATRCALLFPIDWPEPFGLVMIEAMACGTPVIASGAARCPR